MRTRAAPNTDAEPRPAELRPDWLESLTLAADLAVLGIVVVLGCLPVVTAGAVVAAASSAVDRACRERRLTGPAEFLRTVARAFTAGLGATAVAIAAALVLFVDLRLMGSGAIAGGTPVAVAIALLAVVALAVASTTVVRVGQTGAEGWIAGLRWALALLRRRPLVGLAMLVPVALAVLLGASIPATAILLPGFVLYGLHAIVRRAAR
jgi:hypothetical protein